MIDAYPAFTHTWRCVPLYHRLSLLIDRAQRVFRRNCAGRVLVATLALWLGGLRPAPAQSLSLKPTGSTGTFMGAVTNDKGKPVVGALVSAVRMLPGAGRRIFSSATDQAGKYQISGAPPSFYQLCVNVAGTALLDPCHWSAKPPTWNLVGGQVAIVDIPLVAGSWLHVRVDDPSQKAAAIQQSAKGPPFVVGARAMSGAFLSMTEASKDSSGRNFRIAVPRGQVFQYLINPGTLTMNDKAGKAVNAKDGPQSIQVDQDDQTLRFAIK
jgi:hypothetical protein